MTFMIGEIALVLGLLLVEFGRSRVLRFIELVPGEMKENKLETRVGR